MSFPVKTRSSMTTGSGHLAFLGCGCVQIFRQVVSIRVMKLINTNVMARRLAKRPCTRLLPSLKNFICGNENVTHSAQSKFYGRNGIFFGIFCLEYLSRRSEEVDCHFANYRFQFRFVPFRLENYSKPKLTHC